MNKIYELILPSSYEYLRERLNAFLDNGISRLLTFFNIDNCEKFKIIIYDKKEDYQKVFNPPYEIGTIAGCFGHDRIDQYADLNEVTEERFFTCILHEITHLLYQNYVQEKEKRIVWFDEGLASNLSREKQKLEDDNKLKEFLNERVYGENKMVPDISYLHIHGEKFGQFVDRENNSYNGYDWSYLMIRYLIETMPKEELDKLMRSYNAIISIEESIVKDTNKYFKSMFKTK